MRGVGCEPGFPDRLLKLLLVQRMASRAFKRTRPARSKSVGRQRMPRRRTAFFALQIGLRGVVILAGVAGLHACRTGDPDSAGSVVSVPDEVSCSRCEIDIRTVLRLEVPPTVPDGFAATIRVDPQGRFWTFRNGEMPALFDRTGRFLGIVGRSGRGPGEFVIPHDLLVLSRDSLLVLDASTRRATLLDSNLTLIRSFGVPTNVSSATVVSWPDSVVISGRAPLAESVEPLHRLSFDGPNAVVESSFKLGDGDLPPEMMLIPRHRLSRPRQGRFWSAWERRYDLKQWTADGVQHRKLERRPPWFAGVSPTSYDWRNQPPPSSIAAIEEDDAGLLWVLILVARSSWREAWADAPPSASEARPKHELLFATMIEVIDAWRGQVVARSETDGYAIGALPGGRAAVYKLDVHGEGRVEILSLRLIKR